MIGRTLSHYRIVDEIGAGGMGVVYRATDGRLDRSVALKVLPADAVADAVLRQRFLNEARAASALNHPNIVTIYDVVQDDGIDAIVMELVDGISLRERLNRGRLSTGDALNVARQIADALAAAHRAGIVHRDLKPANIIVSERGQAKVLDFGIAKLEFGPTAGADDTRLGPLTVAGTVLGTAAYMSPEQARGESIDGRTDIFALGVVLYEMLTRKAPFAAPTLAGCLQKLVNEDPAPLTSFGVEVPPAVEATIRRALAKSPGERFQTMDAMFEVLDTLASGGTPAVSSVAPARAAEPARRRRPLMATLAVVVIALTGAAVAYQAGWFTAARPAGDLATLPLPSTPFEAFERGQALLARYDRDGYIDQGIESFRRALSLRQDYPAALAGLGLAYWRKYREERDPLHLTYAFQHATQAMALDPHLTLAAVSLASAEIERGELDQADTRLADALVRNPGDADVLSTQAYLRLRQRRVDDAIATIRQAVATRATDWSLPLMEGVFLMAGGRPVEAVAALKGALTLAPDSALVLRNLGAAHYAADQYPEAASAFQGALQIKPDPAVYSNLGTLQFARGLYQDAVEAFDRAVKLGANDYRRWSNLADALRLTPGRMDDARKAYGTALQLLGEQLAGSPGDIDLTTRRVVMLAKSGNCGEALSAAGPLRAPSAKRPAALYRLGVALEVCDRRDDALAVVTQAVTAGWSLREVQQDPEMVRLRADARFHQFVSSLPRPPERSPAPHP